MKDTIKAKVGYVVHQVKAKGHSNETILGGRVCDGENELFTAQYRSMEDYIDECKNGNNECAVKYEVFTTVKGNQFIYWGDTETGEDFITKVTK